MSRILDEFAQPFLDPSQTPEEVSKVLDLAALAWDLAALPAEQRVLDGNHKLLGDPAMQRLLARLIVRKETLFSNSRLD